MPNIKSAKKRVKVIAAKSEFNKAIKMCIRDRNKLEFLKNCGINAHILSLCSISEGFNEIRQDPVFSGKPVYQSSLIPKACLPAIIVCLQNS